MYSEYADRRLVINFKGSWAELLKQEFFKIMVDHGKIIQELKLSYCNPILIGHHLERLIIYVNGKSSDYTNLVKALSEHFKNIGTYVGRPVHAAYIWAEKGENLEDQES